MTERGRVLVVDDADLALTTLRTVLERAGHQVRVATTLADARATFEAWSPECVIIDHRLPDGEGTVLLDELRSSTARPFRAVLMSGDPLPPVAVARADAFLLKPAGARVVLDAVRGTPEGT